MDDRNDLLSQSDAAEEIGVSRQTMWQWTKDGIIKTVKVGRTLLFRRSDVERLKRERKQQGE